MGINSFLSADMQEYALKFFVEQVLRSGILNKEPDIATRIRGEAQAHTVNSCINLWLASDSSNVRVLASYALRLHYGLLPDRLFIGHTVTLQEAILRMHRAYGFCAYGEPFYNTPSLLEKPAGDQPDDLLVDASSIASWGAETPYLWTLTPEHTEITHRFGSSFPLPEHDRAVYFYWDSAWMHLTDREQAQAILDRGY